MPARAQYDYSLNYQTNIINVSSNWSGGLDYVVGSNTYLNALILNSSGVLSNGAGPVGYTTGASNNSVRINGGVWSNQITLYIGLSGAGNSMVISHPGQVH